MAVYLVGISGVFGFHEKRQDVIFYLQWHSLYVIALGTMVAIPAIQAERKSRRILAVLSKGIHRWQYLAGLLAGCAMMSALMCVIVGSVTYVLCQTGGYPAEGLLVLMAALFACSVCASALGLCFSVFLHPLLATVATSTVLLAPLLAERVGGHLPEALFPVMGVADVFARFEFHPPQSSIWGLAASALLQAVMFLAAGAVIFARRDVTISPE
jgi:ABC-type transport system involved in multi-copper enzyme maturation permease subunit